MARYIAFLRALNVGGHTVKMSQLKSIFESLGYFDVETFIASGNVIFSTKSSAVSAMEKTIARKLEAELGYKVATFIRTDSEVAAIAEREVFTKQEIASAHSVNVGMLSSPLSAAAQKALLACNTDTELFRLHGNEIHFLCRIPMADSKFSNSKFEKQIGTPTSFRNVNTIVRLSKKYTPK